VDGKDASVASGVMEILLLTELDPTQTQLNQLVFLALYFLGFVRVAQVYDQKAKGF
jgi:hypothetical protein